MAKGMNFLCIFLFISIMKEMEMEIWCFLMTMLIHNKNKRLYSCKFYRMHKINIQQKSFRSKNAKGIMISTTCASMFNKRGKEGFGLFLAHLTLEYIKNIIYLKALVNKITIDFIYFLF